MRIHRILCTTESNILQSIVSLITLRRTIMKPIIGITCKREDNVINYTNAITNFDGEPYVLAAFDRNIQDHLERINEYINSIDGLLLTGGGDIDPARYSQERYETISGVSRSRDALEIQLCQKALEADKPIFGICRGIQIMSVTNGGYLYQDINDLYPQEVLLHKQLDEDAEHEIEISPYSRLSEIVNNQKTVVNSSHKQAVNRLGDGYVATAHSSDGIIEAMEIPSRRFVIGVQYHPERMLLKTELYNHASKLFASFINAATATSNIRQ